MPDFRNLGTVLRILVVGNLLALFVALMRVTSFSELGQRMLLDSALLQPILLSMLLVLYLLDRRLQRLPYWQAAGAIVLLSVGITWGYAWLGGSLFDEVHGSSAFVEWRRMLLAASLSGVLLTYFRWRARAMSPALQGARLQALQARIRPHFLFNSINAVLAIVRAEPRRAETALEDMADLFRMAMGDGHDLVTLKHEVLLAERYLSLERLRMGERLQVHWDKTRMPPGALIPPLLLQPLLENAVYHGIEPLAEGGVIEIAIYAEERRLHLSVRNPLTDKAAQTGGNHLALSNIRERLSLLFDVEAEYRVTRQDGSYDVHIVIPLLQP
ncbi:MAG: histidine kinase [Pseudomonadota bacterium]